MIAGALGEESFAPSQKVTNRWESFDVAKSGRAGEPWSGADDGYEGAQGKSKRGCLHQGIPNQNLASSQNSKLAANWL